uniref:Uncharacterized protein n=1 Tax=Echeneis naucrates TaxID=173247 RepID=A0A665T911_ECHNA
MFGQTFKNFSIDFNFLNERETFSSGDPVTGHFSFQLTKETKVSSIIVCLQGWAEVHWSSGTRKHRRHYHYKLDYFKTKAAIVQESSSNGRSVKSRLSPAVTGGTTTLRPGVHTYPFSCQLPLGDFPTSFKGINGKIVMLISVAPLPRCCSSFLFFFPFLQAPLSGSNKMALYKGTKVVAFIQNKLSRDIKPKYFLYKKISYFAEKKRVETKDILKEVGEAIPPSSSQTVTRIITIPPTTCVSILNCNIIRTQYRLRVYLDVKYATDPQIKFNIVILPALQRGEEEHPPAYPGFAAFYMYGGSSFPQNQTASVPSAPPPSYGTYGMYPGTTCGSYDINRSKPAFKN